MAPGEDDRRAEASDSDVSEERFQRLAEFRHHVRQFLQFSEESPRSRGIEPRQHQLLLTIKGSSQGTSPTPHGKAWLHRLSVQRWKELCVSGPALSESLQAVTHHLGRNRGGLA